MAGKKILVIEDDPRQRRWITTHLGRLQGGKPYLLEAEDARKGIALALHEKPDLIVLDDSLPRLSGTVVCQELKRDPETAPIKIVLLMVRETRRNEWFGADAYLSKPYDAGELLSTAERLLQA